MVKNSNYIPFGFSTGRETVQILRQYPELSELPHGSGIDADYYLSAVEGADQEPLVKIEGSYHFMDECGGYSGWMAFCLFYDPGTAVLSDIELSNESMDEAEYRDNCDLISECLSDLFADIGRDIQYRIRERETIYPVAV